MIDIQALDRDLIQIIEKRNELSQLDYSAEHYDTLEETIHALEDDFLSAYGEYIEDGISEVYEEFHLPSEVLSPLSYLARFYHKMDETETGPTFNVTSKDGLPIEIPGHEDKDTRLVILPNPTRLFLILKGKGKEVWRAGQEQKTA
ncbi:MAG: hypothetical protein ACFCUI_06010 [Bernardetiaceae bacterium]